MSKKTKKFKDYYEEDEWGTPREDRKRYDKKKANIQKARREKKELKNSYTKT